MSNLGLDPDRLTSLDEHGHKRKIIPAEVSGFFRRHRDWTQFVLIAIFLLLPWIQIGQHQAILIDLPRREFAFFGFLFYAHDAPLVFFILAFATLGLALATAVWGRVWCGWACPQTVFIDAIYRRIEKWTEGTYLKRRALEQEPLNFRKFFKRSTKWFLFFVVSSLISHSFVAYFVGSERLLAMIFAPPGENWSYFLLISAMTAILLFDFGWFREQFCVIMCPYGRFQSVLMDSTSLAVIYDSARGEPRKGQVPSGQKPGDCVSCQRCVQVCPTGIDIRNGVQMECIACTACIDACDEIMDKVKKPKGLIRYSNIRGTGLRLLKPRVAIYGGLILILFFAFITILWNREELHVALLRGQGSPYSEMQNEAGEKIILNQLKLHLKNQSEVLKSYRVQIRKASSLALYEELELVIPENPLHLSPGQDRTIPLFIKSPRELFLQQKELRAVLELSEINSPKELHQKSFRILGPSR